jgi:hypothetical protein
MATIELNEQELKLRKKAVNLIGEDVVSQTEKMSLEELKEVIANCELSVGEHTDEMKANEEFRKASDVCKLMRQGLTAAIKPYKVRKQYAAMIAGFVSKSENGDKTW